MRSYKDQNLEKGLFKGDFSPQTLKTGQKEGAFYHPSLERDLFQKAQISSTCEHHFLKKMQHHDDL